MKTLFYIHKVAFYITLFLYLTLIYGAIAEFFLGCLQLITAAYLLFQVKEMSEEALEKFRLYGKQLLFFTAFALVGVLVSLIAESASIVFFIVGLIYAMLIAYLFVDMLEALANEKQHVESTTKEIPFF
jgi:membrane protein YqaA with SNARE-associated domain